MGGGGLIEIIDYLCVNLRTSDKKLASTSKREMHQK